MKGFDAEGAPGIGHLQTQQVSSLDGWFMFETFASGQFVQCDFLHDSQFYAEASEHCTLLPIIPLQDAIDFSPHCASL